MASAAPGKKFKNSNLNAVLGAPKQTVTNVGPAVRTAAVIKPKAKPKGLVALGKAAGVGLNARKGAAWSQLESKAKAFEKVKEDAQDTPEWAVIDFEDLEKTGLGESFDDEELDENESSPKNAMELEETQEKENALERMRFAGNMGAAPYSEREAAPEEAEEYQRQFSKSHRSYLSMEYAEGSSVGVPSSPDRVSQPSPQMQPSEPSPKMQAGRSPIVSPSLHPQRAPGRSWADQYEQSDEEDFLPSDHQTSYMSGPPAEAPPPSRRPPPQAPPPPAPQQPHARPGLGWGGPSVSASADAMSPLPHMAPGRYSVPPCPDGAPPPGPSAKAPGGPDSKGFAGAGQRAETHRSSPPESPGLVAARKFDARMLDERRLDEAPGRDRLGSGNSFDRARDEEAERPPTRQRAWANNPDEGPPPRSAWGGGKGRSQAPSHGPPPVELPPSQGQADWAPPRALGGQKGDDRDQPGNANSCWGPAVAYTPAFAPRGPVNRPMNEDFVNSGWKDKKLWEPPKAEDNRAVGGGGRGGGRAKASGKGLAEPPVGEPQPKSAGKGHGATASAVRAPPGYKADLPSHKTGESHLSDEDDPFKSGKGALLEEREEAAPKIRKPPKVRPPKGSLEALDGDSSSHDSDSSSGDDDEFPPEYAVLDLTVPRTALVINVSHVLKRLSGCCSLNQLNKALKTFHQKTGVTLETFLRANPMTFKLEGRIVYMVDREGKKWSAPEDIAAAAAGKEARTKGKGKGESKSDGKGKAKPAQDKGKGKDSGYEEWQEPKTKGKGKGESKSEGKGKGKGKGESKSEGKGKGKASQKAAAHEEQWAEPSEGAGKKKRGGRGKKNDDYEWSSHAWDNSEWSSSAWKNSGSQWSW